VTSISTNIPGHASWLMVSSVCAGIGVEPKVSWRHLPKSGLIADVGHVGDHLDDIAEGRAVLFQRALDLVEGVFALGGEIALVKDVAALPFSSSAPTPARKIILPGPVTVTASEKRPLVHSL